MDLDYVATRLGPASYARRALLLSALLLAGCGGSLPPGVPRMAAFDARRLDGGWHVLASNFPLWLDGKKRDPIFLYRLRSPIGAQVELEDTVAYTESGRRETIEGTDTQDIDRSSHFTWRGNGLLALFSSDWAIVAVGPGERWMVLYFTATLATPEGVDVIGSSPVLTPEELALLRRLLAGDPFLREKSKGLVWLPAPSEPR